MTYTRKSMFDRVLAVMLSILMVVALLPASVIGAAAETNPTYATVSTYTGGTITNNGTANVEVLVENTTLTWVEANALRAEGWWVGIDVVAPADYSADATYKVKTNPTAEYGDAKSFAEMKDGENDIQLWFPVSEESLKKFASENRNLTMTYAFDWDANEEYEQTIVFSVVPSEKIVLTKNGEQVYPKIVNYGTVSTYTGGTIKDNGTANVEVLVEETTLQWVEANALRAEGWWVGIDVVAPDDFSADATYKVKTNPTAEYGAAKNFAEMKDGEKDIQLWFPVLRESLEKFASEGRNLTMTYAFDWNADGEYEQEVAFSVVPSEKIVLMKGEDQVYPVLKSTVTVSKNEGGSVSLNGDTTGTLVVENGTTVNVVVEAETGYQISKVTINGKETVVDAKNFTTAIENIATDATVSVTFIKLYTVTVTGNDKGSVSTTPEGQGGSVTVVDGSKVTVTATPETGYRVSGVKINGVDQTVSGANNSGYTVELTADTEYSVEVTFAPNIYKVEKEAADNGDFEIKNPSVEHGGSTVVVVTPGAGYTVDTFKADGATVSNITKDETGIRFTVSDIKSDVNVVVTFKATAKANTADVSKDTENVALRKNETLFVVKDGDVITFKSEYGIRMYDDLVLIAENIETKVITIPGDTTISSIELYYQAEGELYADWHVVEMKAIRVAVDKDSTQSSLTPNAPNENGYYNSTVTFSAIVKDNGDFSGIGLVEYWITLNGIEGRKETLYNYETLPGDIKNAFEGTFTVDAEAYNSKDVKVTLRVVDRAGNEEIVEKGVKINSSKPTVSVKIDGVQNSNAQDKYYSGARTLTITIIDREDTFSSAKAAKGLSIYKNGTLISVAASDITWNHTDGSNQYVGTYVFADDAHYEWSFIYTNLAGMSNDDVTVDATSKDVYDFYVDKAEPFGLNVSYAPSFEAVLLETITFGFYKAPIEVTITATDATAGIHEFNVTYGSENFVISESELKKDGNKAVYKFTISADFRGSVSFTATDKAGRIAELADDKVVVIDTIAPGVTVIWDPERGQNGKYFTSDRTATIEIEEANFFAQDLDDDLLLITAEIVYNDGSRKIETYKPEFVLSENKYVATITFSEEADYIFDVVYTDRSGNIYDEYPAEEFTIDKTRPVISVEFDNNTAINRDQFKVERKATITVVEHNFNEAAMNVLVDGNKAQVKWKKVENAVDTYVAEYVFTGDAHYTFGVNGKDFADNANDGVATAEGTVAPWAFTVDKSSPVDLKISYEPTFVGAFLESLTFGFYQAPVTVKIEATDDISGIDYFTYSYIVQDGVSTINVGKEKVKVDANGANFITFDIPAQFRGFVSFEVTNKAGVSASTADTNAVVVDSIAPGIDVIYGNYDALNDKYYYKADRTATITINEANFFAKDIENGLLVITRKAVANDGTVKEEILAPQFTKVEGTDKYVATVDFDQDADYTFDIKYTDRSGNVYDDYDADEFTVDKIAPKISIEKANGAYFNADRTVKITVIEHNFRASDFEFDAEAYDVTGKIAINLDSKDYKNYLKNQSSWTQVAPDTWEAIITFDIEGNYKVSATYSDLAGNPQEAKIEDTFCVDKQDAGKSDPNNLKITYKPTFVGTLLETITFGFYQAPVEVTIEATDDIAGVDYFVYSYTVQEGASSINVGKINQKINATRDGETNRWYTTFTIDPQFRGRVSFTAYDKATNHAYLADENVVIVDNVAPGVSVRYENMNDTGYFDAQRKAIIEITEANFFVQDIGDGLLAITVKKTTDAGECTSTVMTPTFVKDASREDVYVAEILFEDAGDYTFDIVYTDRSGNVYDGYEPDVFTVDMTAPVISVSYDNNSAKNNDQFKDDREATIRIVEHNFDPSKVIIAIIANGTEVTDYAEHLKDANSWTKVEGEADTWEAKIRYTKEAHYTFSICCTDKAGNRSTGVNYGESVAPTKFTLDKSAPTPMDITINNESVVGSMDTLIFNKFYGKQIVIKLSANCDISGLESLKYQKIASVDDYDADGAWTAYDEEEGIVVDPSEKLIIYFRAEDKAGNVNIIRSTGIVVDDKKPEGEINAPEIDILPVAPNANGMYKDDVSVDLKVVDPRYVGAEAANNGYYSGLNRISYKIYATDSDALEEGILFDIATNANKGIIIDEADGLVNSWNANITVDSEKFNSNNVYIEVTAVDNAGNSRTTTTKAGQFKIDITAPVIDIEYDNNTVDRDTYFDAVRKATITIRERNFKNEEVVIIITRTDDNGNVTKTTVTPNFTIEKVGNVPKTYMFDGEGRDGSVYYVYTMDYTYNKDGDYKFEIEYVDLAGNECTEKNFAANTAVGTEYEFTIDMTKPVIKVTYDNNDVKNGNYYKADRVATIVITEHNLDPNGVDKDRIVVTVTATDDGNTIAAPVETKWTTSGNKHTATITYNADGLYNFDITVKDKAGNDALDYTAESFYVDKTNPVLKIEKIVDESANNDEGNIGFVMTATDTNFDVFTPVLTAVIRKDNTFETKQLEIGEITDVKNGKVFTVSNIDDDGIYRIICTVIDKAGNAYSEVTLEKVDGSTYVAKRSGEDTLVTFSVNREGSAFEVNDNTVDIIKRYYVQNVENDIVIVEINVDPLKEYAVTLNGKALEKDKDYIVTEEGGYGTWMKYTYKINKELFADEGEYKIVVSSKDKADNDAFSDVKDAAIEFVVDRTAPVVTVSGIANDGRYQTDKQVVTLIPTDDGGALKTLVVNLVDEEGEIIKEVISLTGEALMSELEANGGKIIIEIEEGLYQNVQIICADSAAGASSVTNTHETIIKNVSVSSSMFMIFWANKPLRWGTICGVSAVAIAVVVFIIIKSKKRDDK